MDKPILKDSMKLFQSLGKIKSRSMFGGFGLFADDTMFALVVNDQLHIRADRGTTKQFEQQGFQPYVYKKRGFPVVTKYFALPEGLWQDQEKILQLATTSLGFAKEEKAEQSSAKPTRLKDLPNLRLATERMLKKAGIDSVERLYESGSVNAFNAIKESHASSVSIELLWALEGAINGTHWSVIPQQRREELINRVN
ncbi:TfoX/Sxy family DNA transformation protein [Vibrio crassostreae]|uniref:TfoX protein n=1 Tax=Vibrio crassostreae TaxID=246167 RepID=A0ABM9QT85_9VIBR|nr:TfoX/Sxy family DNA transformation protein [Vibrio crassostreae]TCL31017.1 regulator of competence-specific genes [Vibrio crassostreae]TCT49474.1 regulator of competence-specific genes [Vibrio crassostreae]TCT63655.1 regulator of competence-specific genes [Vibrio crassostreae]CAK1730194.1 DNA transformation protein TfoX2 [Vibrio crassostreae]CAK2004869.1 DNA transformation protein TfoX2 [Vibrio crassostreae]